MSKHGFAKGIIDNTPSIEKPCSWNYVIFMRLIRPFSSLFRSLVQQFHSYSSNCRANTNIVAFYFIWWMLTDTHGEWIQLGVVTANDLLKINTAFQIAVRYSLSHDVRQHTAGCVKNAVRRCLYGSMVMYKWTNTRPMWCVYIQSIWNRIECENRTPFSGEFEVERRDLRFFNEDFDQKIESKKRILV